MRLRFLNDRLSGVVALSQRQIVLGLTFSTLAALRTDSPDATLAALRGFTDVTA